MYRFIRNICYIIMRILFKFRVEGHENIPIQGGAVLVANHVSWIDPVALACGVSRPVHFMAKNELFKNPFLGWVFRKVYAFPVKRGTVDRQAIVTALKRVRTGNLLGIFPEGTRSKSDELLPFHSGAASFSIKSHVPLVPIYIQGTNKLRLRSEIKVTIGKQIMPPKNGKATKEELSALNNKVFQQFSFLNKQELTYKGRIKTQK